MNRLILLQEQLNRIESLLVGQKAVFNIEELASYTGLQISYIYQLTHSKSIPYSKPRGGKLFFEKKSIDNWLISNKIATTDELEDQANNYLLKNRR